MCPVQIWRTTVCRVFSLAIFSTAPAGGASLLEAAATIELYANFHTAGVIVTIDASDDPDADAVASLSYRIGVESFAEAFPLTRIRDTQFVGSLFNLSPGTSYDVRVVLTDPDGGVLDGVVVSDSVATRSEIVIPSPSTSLHVSPSGSGTACTEASPCALTYGIQQAQPGDHVVLASGVYRQGEISLSRSGSNGSPIVIRAADGEAPILDGSDPQDFFWIHEGGGVYSTTVNVADTHLVAADGERLYPYQNLADLQSLSWGIPGFLADGTTLKVHLAGNADPNPMDMRVSRFNSGFIVDSADHIAMIGLTFRYYGQGQWAKAVYFNGSSDCLVRDCTFELCDLGIGLKRGAHRNVIEYSEFEDTTFEWVWESIKAGAALETGGIRIYDSDPSPRGTVIRHNTFHDFFDGFGACPGSDTGTTIETDVHDNLIYRVGDDGFETDGYCSNLRIWDNTISEALIGISLAPVYTGPVYAIRNLIYLTGAGTSQAGYTGSCFKFNSGFDPSGVMYLFHNTCDAARPGNDALAIKSPGDWDLISSRNNIWSATAYAIDNANPTQPLDLDFDNLSTTLANELVYWSGLPDRHLRTLAELQSATGQELNGFNVDPNFVDPASGNYSLTLGSDLVDAGVVIPGINDGFNGAAPDIGAFESDDAIFSDDFENGNLSQWSTVVPTP
jgi:hypothetical protein